MSNLMNKKNKMVKGLQNEKSSASIEMANTLTANGYELKNELNNMSVFFNGVDVVIVKNDLTSYALDKFNKTKAMENTAKKEFAQVKESPVFGEDIKDLGGRDF